MSKKEFNAIVFIGRFQPVHNAHVKMLEKAGHLANKVITIFGSSKLPRSFKNPWIDRERGAMLEEVIKPLAEKTGAEYVYEFNPNTIYNNDAWAIRIQRLVAKHTNEGDKVAMIGHKKDKTSFYLDMFPQWQLIEEKQIEPLSATQIRDVYFDPENCNLNWFTGVLPPSTIAYLRWFKDSPEYNKVAQERTFIMNYKKKYEHLPYEPVFLTTDAVVVQAGHILMVTRKEQPGAGLLALPGGFVSASKDASVEDAMIRELMEETSIKVPEKVLRGNIQEMKVFDAIDRSTRGRTITHAFHIRLTDGEWKLPKVKGGDDAADAQWIPIGLVKSEECFEDHYDIIQYFLGE